MNKVARKRWLILVTVVLLALKAVPVVFRKVLSFSKSPNLVVPEEPLRIAVSYTHLTLPTICSV